MNGLERQKKLKHFEDALERLINEEGFDELMDIPDFILSRHMLCSASLLSSTIGQHFAEGKGFWFRDNEEK
jgi:hypothetical protein